MENTWPANEVGIHRCSQSLTFEDCLEDVPFISHFVFKKWDRNQNLPSQSFTIFSLFTFLPPVIFVAMTISFLLCGCLLSHFPISASVAPSGFFAEDGIGYCSAVSSRFIPEDTALSKNFRHKSSFGALKSSL